ncbi:class I SAM-dependent methyltransferase [Thermoactinospora rubra]|uniref:class I SAM-dependent methyltransferase n=1 Tax=Thermoactinospora rubra TaxID=1088767 RepID=UPI000A1061C6|nr:class I SAM-dependent methyltransferase [Thermoactinospora rubra]
MSSAVLQGRLWGAATEDWSQLAEPAMTPVYEAVFDAIRVGDGTRLLDAGCGAGLALQLARRRGAVVAGLDAAAGLLAVARRRLPHADLREGDLERLPYPGHSFDAVTSFNAVQYAADPVAALRELRRVAVPGAPVAVVTWGPAERCETRVVLAAIGALLPPPPPGAPGPFALSAPGALEELVRAAGLNPQDAGEAPMTFDHPDLDTAVRAHLSSGPARRAIEQAGPDAVAEAIRGALAPGVEPDGRCRQRNVFRYLIAAA